MCAGREFQTDGEETEKEREAKWLVTTVGSTRRPVLTERKVRVGVYGEINSER